MRIQDADTCFAYDEQAKTRRKLFCERARNKGGCGGVFCDFALVAKIRK
jgi:hypothetical protein